MKRDANDARDPAPTRIAWIAGGSTGIGFAIARELIDAGYLVVISARNEQPLREACSELARADGRADFVIADVSQRDEINRACRDILDRYGRIDVLVNSAGFNVKARKWDELIPDQFDAVLATNLTGTFNTIHAVLPSMRANGGGMIVNISSVAGKQINPEGGVAYSVAKHGVFVMSQLLNQSELKNGIRTCVVSPSGVDTRAHAWRSQDIRESMMKPDDVARAVRFAIETPPHTAIFEIDIYSTPRRG